MTTTHARLAVYSSPKIALQERPFSHSMWEGRRSAPAAIPAAAAVGATGAGATGNRNLVTVMLRHGWRAATPLPTRCRPTRTRRHGRNAAPAPRARARTEERLDIHCAGREVTERPYVEDVGAGGGGSWRRDGCCRRWCSSSSSGVNNGDRCCPHIAVIASAGTTAGVISTSRRRPSAAASGSSDECRVCGIRQRAVAGRPVACRQGGGGASGEGCDVRTLGRQREAAGPHHHHQHRHRNDDEQLAHARAHPSPPHRPTNARTRPQRIHRRLRDELV